MTLTHVIRVTPTRYLNLGAGIQGRRGTLAQATRMTRSEALDRASRMFPRPAVVAV